MPSGLSKAHFLGKLQSGFAEFSSHHHSRSLSQAAQEHVPPKEQHSLPSKSCAPSQQPCIPHRFIGGKV